MRGFILALALAASGAAHAANLPLFDPNPLAIYDEVVRDMQAHTDADGGYARYMKWNRQFCVAYWHSHKFTSLGAIVQSPIQAGRVLFSIGSRVLLYDPSLNMGSPLYPAMARLQMGQLVTISGDFVHPDGEPCDIYSGHTFAVHLSALQ